MSTDPIIETLGHDSLAVSQGNLYIVEKPTHLPECWATYPSDPEAWCICDELRACEQRVLGLRLDDLNVKSFNAGLDAAINAAENQHIYMSDQPLIVTGFNVAKSEILQIIRALKGKL
jgi:hypothetical protein